MLKFLLRRVIIIRSKEIENHLFLLRIVSFSYYLSVDVGSCSEAVGTSFTAEDAATMSTEDARCVLCLVSMSFSQSHVVSSTPMLSSRRKLTLIQIYLRYL